MGRFIALLVSSLTLAALPLIKTGARNSLEAKLITSGPKHHIFGYIGHVRTIPWNASGRYILALQATCFISNDSAFRRLQNLEVLILDDLLAPQHRHPKCVI